MTQITKSAQEKLQAELAECIAKRPEITETIRKTKEMGDLRENAGYHDARERQSFNEGRIKELEEILKYAEIVEMCDSTECVGLGSTVKVLCVVNNVQMDLQIVSFAEADPAQRKISDQSPLAQALMGKKKGDKILVTAPNGEMEYQILEIK
jgi:transcription elongation factor GreA